MTCDDPTGHAAESWAIPPLGETASAPVPDWLVAGIASGSIKLNRLGGLDLMRDGFASASGLPGDLIVLDVVHRLSIVDLARFNGDATQH